ncbi:MAG: dihydropyrimidine dehydrogenase, partial [Thermoprotei archaeon]
MGMAKVKPRERMLKRPPEERVKDFNEVALGFTEEQAVREAARCLGCPHKPCMGGCPVGVDVPRMLKLVAERRFEEAYKLLKKKCPIPAITGRVCPQEKQCEGACTLAKLGEPVAIGAIERFLADWAREHGVEEKPPKPKPTGKRVAVVGSGPASIVVAADLAKLGYEVMMFEALHVPGGVLMYGIPEYRLPKEIVRQELEYLTELGVNIELGVLVG